MRKTFLVNEKKEEQKKRTLVVTIGIFLIAIMAFSTIGYVFLSKDPTMGANSLSEYTFKFVPVSAQDGSSFWQTNIDGSPRQFTRLPSQVAYVDVTQEAAAVIPILSQLPTVIIVVNPDDELVAYTYGAASLLFGDLYSEEKQIIPAFTNASPLSPSIPVISCQNQSFLEAQNASGQVPIIQIQIANDTQIRTEQNCLIVEGFDGESILSAVEKLRYLSAGVDFSLDPGN